MSLRRVLAIPDRQWLFALEPLARFKDASLCSEVRSRHIVDGYYSPGIGVQSSFDHPRNRVPKGPKGPMDKTDFNPSARFERAIHLQHRSRGIGKGGIYNKADSRGASCRAKD